MVLDERDSQRAQRVMTRNEHTPCLSLGESDSFPLSKRYERIETTIERNHTLTRLLAQLARRQVNVPFPLLLARMSR